MTMLQITLIKSDEIQRVVLTPETMLNKECLVGRDQRCNLILNDPLVSSAHGKFFFLEGNFYYSDIGSTNGSYINNEIALFNKNYLLKPTDVIQIGLYTLLISSLENNASIIPAETVSPSQYMPLALINPASLKRWTEGDITVCCVQVIDETHDVKTFCFVAQEPVLFTYQPGQFVRLELSINGSRVMRPYSISSTPSRPHTLEITVKRALAPDNNPNAPLGLVSNWLHENIIPGSEVKLKAPMGNFTCFANPARKLLLISAGSGITPMMSMSRWICDTRSNIDVVFVYSARSQRDIIFRQELELMAARYPNFKPIVTITRPQTGQAWLGYTGRIKKSMLLNIISDLSERAVYVCGSHSFIQTVKSVLESLEFPMENYYEEEFSTAKTKPQNMLQSSAKAHLGMSSAILKLQTASRNLEVVTNGSRSLSELPALSNEAIVVFAKSEKEVTCHVSDSILQIAEQSGINLPWGCGAGNCGACKQRLLEGQVSYEKPPKYKCSPGDVLSCVARPVGRVVIDA